MFFRVLLCIAMFVFHAPAMAVEAQGSIGADILSPRTMDLKSLKKLCKEEPQTMACELYKERVLDKKANKMRTYSVYTAHFQ